MKRVSSHWMYFVVAFGTLLTQSCYADLPDFTQLAEKNGPAVVNVQATHNAAENPQMQPGEPDEQEIPEIFRRFFGPQGRLPHADSSRISLGSGFIISADGYVLTNNHVVDGSDQVLVRLSDRRELEAKVIGTDPQTDIALLKVNAGGLPVVSIGDSKKLKPGQWVVAIGSPFNFDHSVTHGIISSIGRSFGAADQQYVPFIQSDVPINRGNSGGPLFNLDGQVVGINSQIFSNTGGYMGVSFAIPIDVAMSAVDQIKDKGRVSRGMIGVQIQNVDGALAQSLKLPRLGGALVNAVTPGSGADKADIHVGDVILSYNGHEIDHSSDLPPLVGSTKPGSKAELSIFRDGKTLTVPVQVGELPQDKNKLAGSPGEPVAKNSLGIVVDDLTAEQRKQLKLKDDGVLITHVSGAAQRARLQPGDVVLMVGRKPVKSVTDFNAAIHDVQPGDSVMLLVRRDEITTFIAVAVPKDKG